MSSDEEIDPLVLSHHQSHQTQPPLHTLLFPRSKTTTFMPLTSSSNSFRRNSSYRSLRPDSHRHRSQSLLERSRTPAHAWDKYRKPEGEIKVIKSKKVRQFYENQVFFALSEIDNGSNVDLCVELFD